MFFKKELIFSQIKKFNPKKLKSDKRYKKYYPLIEKRRKHFDKLLNEYSQTDNQIRRWELTTEAALYASNLPVGYYTSSVLENFFLEKARRLEFDKDYDRKYKKNSFLHVLTQGYKTGGHTRVVERWIKNAPENQIHSVVIIDPAEDKLSDLETYVKEKNGEYILFDNNLKLMERGYKLRDIGLNYEYIVLHTHMHDPSAIIAFGTEKFKRPVMLYNHASHIFWLGKSVADIVLDLVKDDIVTKVYRNISDRFFVGIPTFVNQKENILSKEEARKKLGIPLDKKIIISTASFFKYNPIGKDSFYNIIKKVLDKNTYCYVIGPSLETDIWKKYNKKSKGHIIPLGIIDFNKGYLDYLSAADLCVDSYPLCSWTALMDGITSNVPALSLKCSMYMLDYLKDTRGYCLTERDFVKKAKKILKDKNFAEEILHEEQKSLFEMQSPNAWNERITKLMKILPQEHKVKKLNKDEDFKDIVDLSVLNGFCSLNSYEL